jgi:multicomponent Na+:H+ antiporter subunit G
MNALDTAIELLSGASLVAGAFFFLAGTAALLRFPDVYTRLHAIAKADNLGLGCTILGLLLRAGDFSSALKLVLVWLLVLAGSAAVGFLIARRARRYGIVPWQAERPTP